MRVRRITPDLGVTEVGHVREFFTEFLGLEHEDLGLDWVTRYVVPGTGERGYEIVHPLVTEPWGVRRFFVRAPGGPVLDIAQAH